MTHLTTTLLDAAPGLQVSDERNYPPGLIKTWAEFSTARFPVAVKVRQAHDNGALEAIHEAASLVAVRQIHVALIPKWRDGRPDWKWLRDTIRAVAIASRGTKKPTFLRLGNYRDGANEGCTFEQHAFQELFLRNEILRMAEFRHLLWSVGDDRGPVAAIKGWAERRRVFSGSQPDCLEIQSYGEGRAGGLAPDHIGLLSERLREEEFMGEIAMTEVHRAFKGRNADWSDLLRLTTTETGEYLRAMAKACAQESIGMMVFTGDTVFEEMNHLSPLNDAGRALFNLARVEAEPWQPSLWRRMVVSWRLRGGLASLTGRAA